MRILYVEDEKYLADAVIHMLKKADIAVDWADDGEKGLDMSVNPIYDAIVLDVMLPKLSGFDILKAIRDRNIKTPVIMLSALSEVEDKVKGLTMGADDYLSKPFKTSELIARLNALNRRPPLKSETEIHFEDLNLNLDNRTLNNIPLTEKEEKIMEVLIKNPGVVQKKEYLLAKIWGSDSVAEENYVEVYMSYLRKKLKTLKSKCVIKTIRNLGYKLITK
ncbi:MAG: response regulator transcription factor [Candidatus Saccharibacteria bacterium]|nr:response regulator transcription factor [Candidatus Saccharibacteria bacterium]